MIATELSRATWGRYTHFVVEFDLSNEKEPTLFLRCTIDDLILPANLCPRTGLLIVVDGDEGFVMEAVEAAYYELVAATADEVVGLERAGYRLLRRAADFELHQPHDADRFGSCNCRLAPDP